MIEGNLRPDVERSFALHREVAERLRRDPRLLELAKTRVQRWFEDGSAHRSWATAWSEVLEGGLDEVVALLTDRSERAHDLRQVSPFAGTAIAHGLVDQPILLERLSATPIPTEKRRRIEAFIARDFER